MVSVVLFNFAPKLTKQTLYIFGSGFTTIHHFRILNYVALLLFQCQTFARPPYH